MAVACMRQDYPKEPMRQDAGLLEQQIQCFWRDPSHGAHGSDAPYHGTHVLRQGDQSSPRRSG
jgi:hypothetical protein